MKGLTQCWSAMALTCIVHAEEVGYDDRGWSATIIEGSSAADPPQIPPGEIDLTAFRVFSTTQPICIFAIHTSDSYILNVYRPAAVVFHTVNYHFVPELRRPMAWRASSRCVNVPCRF